MPDKNRPGKKSFAAQANCADIPGSPARQLRSIATTATAARAATTPATAIAALTLAFYNGWQAGHRRVGLFPRKREPQQIIPPRKPYRIVSRRELSFPRRREPSAGKAGFLPARE